MLQLPLSLYALLATSCTHSLYSTYIIRTQKIGGATVLSLDRPARTHIDEHFFSFFHFQFFSPFCVYADPLLSLAVIHPPHRVRFFFFFFSFGGWVHLFSFFPPFEPPSSPVNPPVSVISSPSLLFFVCVCVVVVVLPSHPFPHVFLMCSCTHIVLIPLSSTPTRCEAPRVEGRSCICSHTTYSTFGQKKEKG